MTGKVEFRAAFCAAASLFCLAAVAERQPIDNVIMKGLEISEVRFLEGDRLSDHLAISCKLTVYGQK